MLQSQDDAVIAALRHLGLPVTLTVTVESVTAGGPSDGHLKAGDRILSVDGTPVGTSTEVRAAVAKKKPGQTVTFVVDRVGVDRHSSRRRRVGAERRRPARWWGSCRATATPRPSR